MNAKFDMVHASSSLKPALDAIGKAIDQRFDRLLPVPDDSRAQLFSAMRHAVIGGGKRMRPLLVVASCDLFGVRALLLADPRRPAMHG
jgi:farnesyl diphosphate synthase